MSLKLQRGIHRRAADHRITTAALARLAPTRDLCLNDGAWTPSPFSADVAS
jgi:hypothetical protein